MQPEDLAEELKTLAGRGAYYKGLALLSNLRTYAEVGATTPNRSAAPTMRRSIRDAIHSYPDSCEFYGRLYPIEKVRSAWARLLLKGGKADDRRAEAIRTLGIHVTVAYWRSGGPEWEFLLILAEHMIESRAKAA